MHKPTPHKARAFTLIEILVVVAIIVILVAAVIAVGANIRASAMIKSTQATLRVLQDAADEYVQEANQISGSGQIDTPLNNTGYFSVLRNNPRIWGKIVQKLPATSLGASSIADAWGNTIQYRASAPTSNPPILKGYFISAGPNGTMGTLASPDADDIVSTEAAQ